MYTLAHVLYDFKIMADFSLLNFNFILVECPGSTLNSAHSKPFLCM
jgi:hypothetical protein